MSFSETGTSISVKFSFPAYLLYFHGLWWSVFISLWWNADKIAYSKHLLSLYFTLITALLALTFWGKSIQPTQLNGLDVSAFLIAGCIFYQEVCFTTLIYCSNLKL